MSVLEVRTAYDARFMAMVDCEAWPLVDAKLAQAATLLGAGRAPLPVDDRIAILRRLASLIARDAESLAFQIAEEGGKPLVDARVEVARAVEGVGLAADELSGLSGREVAMGRSPASRDRLAFTTREPIGVVVAISAFNHPLNLVVHQVAPAIAAGCPTLVKPAETTPLSCLSFVRLAHEAGLPEPWLQAVVCDVATAERLATDPRVGFLSFIGSAAVGWRLRSKLAPGARCALEHGGLAPAILHDSADLDRAAQLLTKGGYYHSGQVCVSTQRVFAPRATADALIERLAGQVGALRLGDPTEASTDCGPLILPREVDRVAEWVDDARSGGASVAVGGCRTGNTTYAPTLLVDPPDDALVSRREIFGPVVCVYRYDALADAIHAANDSPFAFQASVFARDIDAGLGIARNLDASAVMINDHTAFRTDGMPFQGRRQSGYGVGGVGHTLRDMTQEKMIVLPAGRALA